MNKLWFSLLWISGGSICGAVLRYLVTLAAQQYAITFPFGTLIVNWSGCFIIGVLTTMISEAGGLTTEARLFLITGFCGSFTTLSSMIYEFSQLLKTHELGLAGVYWGATFLGAFGWFYLGGVLVKFLLRL
jgi:fluoride exporter